MNMTIACCTYLLDEGHKRPCPSGEGCTEHTGHRPETRSPWAGVTWNMKLAEKMFEEGKSDEEIAKAVNRTVLTVERWRYRKGFLRIEKRSKPGWDKETAYKLFLDGKTDKEISVAVDSTVNAVKSWRYANGLVRKSTSDWDKELARKLFHEGKTDEEMAAAVGMSVRCIEKFRSREKLFRVRWPKNDQR